MNACIPFIPGEVMLRFDRTIGDDKDDCDCDCDDDDDDVDELFPVVRIRWYSAEA